MKYLTTGVLISILLLLSLSYLLHNLFLLITPSLPTIKINKVQLSIPNFLRFHVIGDFGRLPNNVDGFPILPMQVVANSMNKLAESSPISMVITTGDNFYSRLVSSLDQKVFEISERAFNQSFINNVPWYYLYGNHDCYLSSNFGDYLEQIYSNIYMPTCPWNTTFQVGDFKIGVIFLSCYILCYGPASNPHQTEQCGWLDSLDIQGGEFIWIEDQLKSFQEDPNILWRFVFVHIPVFSISSSDGDDEALKLYLYPLLHKYGVDAIFSGHNHNMQYLTINNTKEPLEYVKQDYDPKCLLKNEIKCNNGQIKQCWNSSVSCGEGEDNCKDLMTYEGTYERLEGERAVSFKKGEHLHQIIQGAGGGLLDPLCNVSTPMANALFGLADFGFTEVTINATEMNIKFIHSNTSKVVYEARVYV